MGRSEVNLRLASVIATPINRHCSINFHRHISPACIDSIRIKILTLNLTNTMRLRRTHSAPLLVIVTALTNRMCIAMQVKHGDESIVK